MHFLCVHCTFGLDTSQTRTIQGSMGVLRVKPSESYIIQLSPLIPIWTGAFPLKRQVLMCWNGRWLLDGLQIEIPMRRINISKILFVVSVVESMVRSDVAKNTYREFSTWHRWLYNIKCFHMFAYQGYPMQWIVSMTRDYIIYILNLDFCYYIVYIICIHTHMMDVIWRNPFENNNPWCIFLLARGRYRQRFIIPYVARKSKSIPKWGRGRALYDCERSVIHQRKASCHIISARLFRADGLGAKLYLPKRR